MSNHLAQLWGRPYGFAVKNGKGNVGGENMADSLEERLGPEIDEALLALDELALDDPEEALATFDTLPEPVQALVEFQLLVARAHQALGQLDAARDLLLALLGDHPENADVHHQLGDVYEDLEQIEEANAHFEKTRRLDLNAYEELTAAERQEGEAELEKALGTIATSLSTRTLKVAVETLPSSADIVDGMDPRTLCHYREEADQLVAYAANLVFEFGDLADEEERQEALVLGLIECAADDLALTDEELDFFGLDAEQSEED